MAVKFKLRTDSRGSNLLDVFVFSSFGVLHDIDYVKNEMLCGKIEVTLVYIPLH